MTNDFDVIRSASQDLVECPRWNVPRRLHLARMLTEHIAARSSALVRQVAIAEQVADEARWAGPGAAVGGVLAVRVRVTLYRLSRAFGPRWSDRPILRIHRVFPDEVAGPVLDSGGPAPLSGAEKKNFSPA